MSNEETVKIRVGMSVSYAIRSTCEHVIDTGYTREEWNDLPEKERNDEANELLDQFVANRLNSWWAEVE